MLLRVFDRLVDEGNTLLVIEHNMELIKCADHIIDLGPEGGTGGGNIVAQGTPEQVADCTAGYTAHYLADALHREVDELPSAAAEEFDPGVPEGVIALRGARHHQLKNIDVDIPRDEMTVVTGLSGSGKSTLAFDIVFAEGQKRFMDVMSPYARQFTEQMEVPDIDRITGIPPTVAIEQNRSRGGCKSTVGTVTEIWQHLRLLYAKLGQAHCPKCGIPVGKRSVEEIEELLDREVAAHPASLMIAAPVVRNRKGHYADLARWAAQRHYPYLRADGQLVTPDEFTPLDRYSNHDVDIVLGEIRVKGKHTTLNGEPCDRPAIMELAKKALEMGDGFIRIIKEGRTSSSARVSPARSAGKVMRSRSPPPSRSTRRAAGVRTAWVTAAWELRASRRRRTTARACWRPSSSTTAMWSAPPPRARRGKSARVPRHAAQPLRPRCHAGRAQHRANWRYVRRAGAAARRRVEVPRAGCGDSAQRGGGDSAAPEIPAAGGLGLPFAHAPGHHALRRGDPAHPPGRPAGFRTARCALCAG